MKHLKRKLMMTLALLITAATSAWAESKPIGLNVEYEAGDVITSTTDVYVYYGEHPTNSKQMAVKITSTQPLTISMIDAYSFGFNGDDALYYLPDGDATGGSAGFIPCVGESTGDATVVHVKSGSGTLTDPYVFGSGPSGTPVPLTRGTGEKINEWTLTNGMPAGNVTVKVKYFPQAEFAMSTDATPLALAPAAIPGVPANTDAPIVTAGTVANIGTSEVKQGTLMYFVSQSTGNTDPVAPTYDTDGWSDKVPTANELKQGDVYVWYYIKGAEPDNIADRTDANTRSDSDIKALGASGFVTLGAEPTYDVTLNDEGLSTDEAAAWKVAKGTDDPAAFPLEGVKKSETVTVTYSGAKKIIGVKAEKKSNNPYANAKLGDLFYSDGTFSSTLEAGKTPIGVIAYLDQEGTDDDEITEKSNGAGHGLVLCLKDAASGDDTQWSTEMVSKFPGQEVNSVDDLKRTENVSGYTNTATLTVDATTAEKYPAAKAAKEYTTLAAPTGTTGWFLPSAQQWVKMIEGLGGLSDGAPNFAESWFDNNHTAADKWEAALSKAGNGNYDSMTSECLYYPSSSEISADKAVSLWVDATDTGSVYGFLFVGYSKNASMAGIGGRVRPVLAF